MAAGIWRIVRRTTGLDLVGPLEVHDAQELAVVADLARRLLLGYIM